MVYGFDETYPKFYARDTRNDIGNYCPNTLYVACSRASEYLYLFNGSRANTLPFITNIDRLSDNVTFYKNKLPTIGNVAYEDHSVTHVYNIEEAIDKIRYYLKHSNERKKIAIAGYERVMRDYRQEYVYKNFFDWVVEEFNL